METLPRNIREILAPLVEKRTKQLITSPDGVQVVLCYTYFIDHELQDKVQYVLQFHGYSSDCILPNRLLTGDILCIPCLTGSKRPFVIPVDYLERIVSNMCVI